MTDLNVSKPRHIEIQTFFEKKTLNTLKILENSSFNDLLMATYGNLQCLHDDAAQHGFHRFPISNADEVAADTVTGAEVEGISGTCNVKKKWL